MAKQCGTEASTLIWSMIKVSQLARVCFQSQLKDADVIAAVQQVVLPVAYEVRSWVMGCFVLFSLSSLRSKSA